jgi:BASS family bile acid:Na+ symporter
MIDRLINVVVTITLIEMMAAVGLGVTFAELAGVARNWRLVGKAALANYVCVPAVTVGLLLVFRPPDPLVTAGFLILAVCPGAPFGPPCAKIAGGNVANAVGLMAILAASSAIAAPVLLSILLPRMAGDETPQVDPAKIVGTLLATQLLPLFAGLCVRQWRPSLAARLQKPANLLSAVLGLATVGLVLVAQFRLVAELGLRAWIGMFALLIASLACGWLLGGPGVGNRKALSLTTALRNVGVGLVIATGNFSGTAAVTAAVVYGIFEIVGSLLLALWWARGRTAVMRGVGRPQPPHGELVAKGP